MKGTFVCRRFAYAGLLCMLTACAVPTVVDTRPEAQSSAAQSTAAYYQSLLGSDGTPPEIAKLRLFMASMPKGGDIHHHYSGALFAETYLEWVDKAGYCISRSDFKVNTSGKPAAASGLAGKTSDECLSVASVVSDDRFYRGLLQRWSDKDFRNHGVLTSPPDEHFFDTFGYFSRVATLDYPAGLMSLKRRAVAEHVQYIETMVRGAPTLASPDMTFDDNARRLMAQSNEEALAALLASFGQDLANNARFGADVTEYAAFPQSVHAGLDDDDFILRYQTYTSRNSPPSIVFSGLYAAFAAASRNPLIVGVNLVGPENGAVSMRDYALHMRMIRYLKTRFPTVKLSLHAGELALGMVPPEGLTFHIREAVDIAGADRIGHGVDIAFERDALMLLKTMHDKPVSVEINLTSNAFILGVRGTRHPLSIYRDADVPFVISTDDAGVSRNDLTSQYVMFAAGYRPSYALLKETALRSIDRSFLDDAEKSRQRTRLIDRFDAF
ncbi:MAG: adenosine deaminase [Pandoraea sp.]|nr:adenosine deaminase [Pandoraea sp.]MDR3398576.1 adenosine deaminase [Pandoraea sp.]